MRKFQARPTDETYGILYTRQDAYEDVMPGLPIRLHNDGTMDPPDLHWDNGVFTVTDDNLFRIYVCQSWKDSVTLEGNEMVAMIPITQPFSAVMIVDADDFLNVDDVSSMAPGTRFSLITGKLMSDSLPVSGSPYVFHLLKKPKALFNGEYEVEVATWGLRTQPVNLN